MNKSELIERIYQKVLESDKTISSKDLELAVNHIILKIASELGKGERIEIRGFGTFSLHYRAPRLSRNPKTGDSIDSFATFVPHFKPSKLLRHRVNQAFLESL